MTYSFCSDSLATHPWWWDANPLNAAARQALPESTDVLVIGSGYTGLHCALQTAAAGRATTVIDAQDLGWGCSSRNGGQISGEIKPGFDELRRRYSEEAARALIGEARGALEWLGDFVEREGLDCDYRRCGRFVAAHSARQFDKLAAGAEQQVAGLERAQRIVEASDQASEIDSPYYQGGLVIDSHCSLDPAAYHAGLLRLAAERGATLVGHCAASRIEHDGSGYRVTTSRGTVRARDLVIATNGYSGSLAPWQQRRVIPIGSYMLATEPMAPERAARLMPKQRVFSDTRRIVVYFRLAPDGRSLLFGGRVSVFESDPVKSLPALRDEMLRIFPQLQDLRISHTWMGFVAYTFDTLPHLGQRDGVYYAMGYCGSGICLASYLGHQLGRKIAGMQERPSAFEAPRFQTRPLYHGNPWFLGASVRYFQLLDRLG